MDAILKTIISKISWDAYLYYADAVNDLALRVYIAQELRAMEQLEGVSDEKIEEVTDIIETTIIETPDEIKKIEEPKEQKEAFQDYINNNTSIRNITSKNYFEKIVVKDGGTVNFN